MEFKNQLYNNLFMMIDKIIIIAYNKQRVFTDN